MKDTKILIAGASGFIGSKLIEYFESRGYLVYKMNNQPPKNNSELQFYTEFDYKILENFDAFINLAGSNISEGRWTKYIKNKILQSRISSTRYLSDIVNRLNNPPKVFINASAIGFYGNSKNQILDESSKKGAGFLADVVEQWEDSININNPNVRVCKTRFGIVISKDGGVIKKLLPFFKLALGLYFGSGKQMVSWIHIKDLCNAMEFIIENKNLEGIINLTSPKPISNFKFNQTIAKFVNRPLLFFLPKFMVKLIFGQMGIELFLFDQNVIPKKLMDSGLEFEHKEFAI